ncbi:MAG: hypothetical protein DRP79_09980, partial [Planctomycetota bacterium]
MNMTRYGFWGTAFVTSVVLFPYFVHGDIVITEIFYHPESECEPEEFVEIFNTGDDTVDLTGWAFTEGVVYRFPDGTRISSGEHLVICRDLQGFEARFGALPGLLGSFARKLNNDGEDIILTDADGEIVDRVDYDDIFPWPVKADGLGGSLELVNPFADNEGPQYWRPSEFSSTEWLHFSEQGQFSGSILAIRVEGSGECLLDDLYLRPAGGGESLVRDGGFENALTNAWSIAADTAERTEDDAHSGRSCVRLQPGDDVLVSQNLTSALTEGETYEISFWYKPSSSDARIVVQIQSEGVNQVTFTSGRDIGRTGLDGGHEQLSPDSFEVWGCGNDIWHQSDAFYFLYAAMEGDASIEATVEWIGTVPDPWSKAGVMIRDSLQPGSAHSMMILSLNYGTRLQFRPFSGMDSQDYPGPALRGKARFRLTRTGEEFSGEVDQGNGFEPFFNGLQFPMTSPVYVGLCVTSHADRDRGLARARFTQVALSGGSGSGQRFTTPELPSGGPTPGRQNSQYRRQTELPPFVKSVSHLPETPDSTDKVTVSAQIQDSNAILSVDLDYQVVPPGGYIRITDPEYQTNWTRIPMRDDGVLPDRRAGD